MNDGATYVTKQLRIYKQKNQLFLMLEVLRKTSKNCSGGNGKGFWIFVYSKVYLGIFFYITSSHFLMP